MTVKPDLLEEIRSRVDLVRLIGDYVPLRKSGRRYLGICPFHNESSPSFSVNPEGQFFYCFGCKASGDLFEFIMRMEGLDFPAAVKTLAEKAGLKWEAQSPEEEAKHRRQAGLYRINAMAAEVYRRALAAPRTGAAARAYLEERGIGQPTAAKFGLGFAPPDYRTLVGVFRRYNCRLEDAAALGLVLPSARGYIDRFRGRLIFPLVDLSGRVVGFGGRIIGSGQPKYLNSSESELFNKSAFLYGLNLARESIRRSGSAVLVEGYLDAISAHQAGVGNVVATMGTALSTQHAILLKRFTTQVVLAYDGDNAGQSATLRGLEVLRLQGLQVRVAVLPSGLDPDDLIRREGAASFQSLIATAIPLLEFMLQRALAGAELGTPEGRAAAVQACLPVLAQVESAAAREAYLRKVAAQVLVHEDNIAADLADHLRNARNSRHKMDNQEQESNTNRYRIQAYEIADNPAEKEILRLVLKEYSHLKRIKEKLKAEEFAPGPLRDIYALIISLDGPIQDAELLRRIDERARPALLELMAQNDGPLPPPRVEALDRCIQRVKVGAVKRRLQEVEAERLALERAGINDERRAACLREITHLNQLRERLSGQIGFGD